MYLCNFGEYGSKLMTGEQVLRWRFEYAEKLQSCKIVESVCDLYRSDLKSLYITKSELINLFYNDIQKSIDCALPLQYMDFLQSKGIDTDLLYCCAVMDCSGMTWRLLPLCLEASQEIEKIKQLA